VSTKRLQEEGLIPETEQLKNVYQQLFPDCTAVIVEGGGHFVQNDKALEVCSLVRDFLEIVDQS